MRYFYDTEFIEDGTTIDLVSIGIVAEDGREYYAVSTEFDAEKASSWVRDYVLPKLPNPEDSAWKSRAQIREEVLRFLTANHQAPELWAWVCGYDHVVLAQLFGDMTAMPKELPHFTCELRQYWIMAGRPHLPGLPPGVHDALVDARHNLAKFRTCEKVLPLDDHTRVVQIGRELDC